MPNIIIDIRKHGFDVYIKFSILHISTLYKTIYRGLSFKGALHFTEISSPSKRLSRRLVYLGIHSHFTFQNISYSSMRMLNRAIATSLAAWAPHYSTAQNGKAANMACSK